MIHNIMEKHINSLYYEYRGLAELMKNVDAKLHGSVIKTVYICGFYINLTSLFPFIQYLLHTNGSGMLEFPSFDITNRIVQDTACLIEIANARILEILMMDGIQVDIKSTRCCGFKTEDECIYIFYDFMNLKVDINIDLTRQKTWLCLVDEIVNTRTVCDQDVSSKTTDFLLTNTEFLFLRDKKNIKYEVPIVGYVRCDSVKMHMIYTFGHSKSDETAILGPYYHFTSFENALQSSNCENNGIVRFALFSGVMLVKQNHLLDSVDEYNITTSIISSEYKYERLMRRVSDHLGLWSDNFNSVYLGQVELDDGRILKNTPYIVLKESQRHSPVSYHLV